MGTKLSKWYGSIALKQLKTITKETTKRCHVNKCHQPLIYTKRLHLFNLLSSFSTHSSLSLIFSLWVMLGLGHNIFYNFFFHLIKVVLIINPVKNNVVLIAIGQFYNFKNILSLTLLLLSLWCFCLIYIQKSTERNMVLWNSWKKYFGNPIT